MSAHWTQRENLAQAIAYMSDKLKQPTSEGERAFLIAYRKEMREELASLEGPDTLASLGLSEWDYAKENG